MSSHVEAVRRGFWSFAGRFEFVMLSPAAALHEFAHLKASLILGARPLEISVHALDRGEWSRGYDWCFSHEPATGRAGSAKNAAIALAPVMLFGPAHALLQTGHPLALIPGLYLALAGIGVLGDAFAVVRRHSGIVASRWPEPEPCTGGDRHTVLVDFREREVHARRWLEIVIEWPTLASEARR